MNKYNEKFIKKNGIDLSKIDTRIYTAEDINWVVQKYGIIGKIYETNISMEYLLGIDINGDMKPYYPDILDSFFDERDSYKSRSLNMLNYDKNNILEGLKSSFTAQKISVTNIDSGKSIICDNGHHRFLILRLLYLHEKSKCVDEKERETIKQKYVIPVVMSEYDLTKTYCKYLINIFQPASIIGIHITDIKIRKNLFFKNKYNITTMVGIQKYKTIEINEEEYQDYLQSAILIGNEFLDSRTTIEFLDGRKQILTDEELIKYTKEIIKNSKHKNQVLKDKSNHSFRNALKQYDSFRKFIAMNFGEEILTFESKIK